MELPLPAPVMVDPHGEDDDDLRPSKRAKQMAMPILDQKLVPLPPMPPPAMGPMVGPPLPPLPPQPPPLGPLPPGAMVVPPDGGHLGDVDPHLLRLRSPKWELIPPLIYNKDVDKIQERLRQSGYKGKDGVSRAALLFIHEQCDVWKNISGRPMHDMKMQKKDAARVFNYKYKDIKVKTNALSTAITAVLKHMLPLNGYAGDKKDCNPDRHFWIGITLKPEVEAELPTMPAYEKVLRGNGAAAELAFDLPDAVVSLGAGARFQMGVPAAAPVPPPYDIVLTGGLYFIRIFTPYCDVKEMVEGVTWDMYNRRLTMRSSYVPTPHLPLDIAKEYGVDPNAVFVQQCDSRQVGPFSLTIQLPGDINVSEDPTCIVANTGPMFVIKQIKVDHHYAAAKKLLYPKDLTGPHVQEHHPPG